jgi:Lon protease-like protein
MTEERVTLDFNRPFRLFPLPACVLLPHATAPLHVFEDRYRAMLRDALDSNGLIAMATTDAVDPSMLIDPLNPPLRPAVVVGYLVQHDRLDDGRYNILLQGLCRAEIVDELDPHPDGYRRAMLKPFGHGPASASDDALDEFRDRAAELLDAPSMMDLQKVQVLQALMQTEEVSTEAFIDLAGMVLGGDSDQRYAVLAERDVQRRADRVLHLLHETRELADQADSIGGPDDDLLD